jgi:DNA transposition AAA+ family ATPase
MKQTEPDHEVRTLHDRIQDLVNLGEGTQSSIAREAGLSSGAVSAWMGGKYRGDNSAIENKLEIWWESHQIRSQTASAMPAPPQFVPTPTSEKILNILRYAQMASDLVVIYGGAGVGKTSATREYERSQPSVWIATMIPDSAGVCACLEEIANAIGLRCHLGVGGARLRREICRKLADTNGLLIIDEAQHLSLGALEEIRSIHDATEIGLAFCGNESVYSRLTGGQRAANFAQLYSRVGAKLRLNRPTNGDVRAIMDVFGVQGSEEYKTLSRIASKPGALRGVVKTLRRGSMIAMGAGQPFNEKHIARAWKDLGGEEA